MKRTYITPSILVVELETDSLMQTMVTSPNLNSVQNNFEVEGEIVIESATYRTTLWQ